MAYGDPEYLFHKYEMFGVMEGHRQKASQLVQQMAGNTLLNTPAEDIVADMFAIDVEGANSTAHATLVPTLYTNLGQTYRGRYLIFRPARRSSNPGYDAGHPHLLSQGQA
jgi:hypothetical protein